MTEKTYYAKNRDRLLIYFSEYNRKNQASKKKWAAIKLDPVRLEYERARQRKTDYVRIVRSAEERCWLVAKSSARSRDIPFLLSVSEYASIFRTPCFYCGVCMKQASPVGLDRKNSSLGYILGNVVSCCRNCNVMKSDILTVDEMRVAMRAVVAFRKVL